MRSECFDFPLARGDNMNIQESVDFCEGQVSDFEVNTDFSGKRKEDCVFSYPKRLNVV